MCPPPSLIFAAATASTSSSYLCICAFAHLCGPCTNKTTEEQRIHRRHHLMGTVSQWSFINLCICVLSRNHSSHTDTKIYKSLFSISANVFYLQHRLMCICFVRKVFFLVNTKIYIRKWPEFHLCVCKFLFVAQINPPNETFFVWQIAYYKYTNRKLCR